MDTTGDADRTPDASATLNNPTLTEAVACVYLRRDPLPTSTLDRRIDVPPKDLAALRHVLDQARPISVAAMYCTAPQDGSKELVLHLRSSSGAVSLMHQGCEGCPVLVADGHTWLSGLVPFMESYGY